MNNKIVVFLLIAISLAGAFYWFQVKPAQVRSQCANETTEKLKNDTEEHTANVWQNLYDLYYQACLNRNGLK